MAAQSCALSLVRQLFHLGAIEAALPGQLQPKKQNFRNHYEKTVECHTNKEMKRDIKTIAGKSKYHKVLSIV